MDEITEKYGATCKSKLNTFFSIVNNAFREFMDKNPLYKEDVNLALDYFENVVEDNCNTDTGENIIEFVTRKYDEKRREIYEKYGHDQRILNHELSVLRRQYPVSKMYTLMDILGYGSHVVSLENIGPDEKTETSGSSEERNKISDISGKLSMFS